MGSICQKICEFPVNLTPAFWPCWSLWVTDSAWFTLTGLSKSIIVSFYWLPSTPPILFYNIMGTISVTLSWYSSTFYLVAHISMCLNHLTFEIVNFLLHYENGLYSFTCILFQFHGYISASNHTAGTHVTYQQRGECWVNSQPGWVRNKWVLNLGPIAWRSAALPNDVI